MNPGLRYWIKPALLAAALAAAPLARAQLGGELSLSRSRGAVLVGQEAQDWELFGDVEPRSPNAPPPPEKLTPGKVLLKLLGVDPSKAPAVALPHRLTFQDGRQLRGELIALEKDEVVWKRADSNELLRFKRAEVRQIIFKEPPPPQRTTAYRNVKGSAAMPIDPAIPAKAILKLPGGDWMHGEVQSPDGEQFTLSLGKEDKLTVPRQALEWLYFSLEPSVAARLAPGAAGLDGWVLPSGNAVLEEKDGWMSVKGASWIGRDVIPSARFELSFEVPADDEAPTILWLQPFGPRPNTYGTGTVCLEFTTGKVRRTFYQNGMVRAEADIPKDPGLNGRTGYRIFYDRGEGRIVVFRNGKQVGDWKMEGADGAAAIRDQVLNGVCLQRGEGLRLGSFGIQPWDGVLPREGEAARTQDLWSTGSNAPIAGKLESIGEKELVFSGQARTRSAGTFLQFPARPQPAPGSDARLAFGSRGELSAAELEVREGRAIFRTNFDQRAELSLETLQAIAFRAVPAQPLAGGALLFKNGDELPGTLEQAESGGTLKWRTPAGQQMEFRPDRIAGIQFPAPAAAHAGEEPGGHLEFRNGDSLRGQIAAIDGKTVQWKHPLFGTLSVAADQLATLRPTPKAVIYDAAREPAAWLSAAPQAAPNASAKPRIVYLDGQFILRSAMQANGSISSDMMNTLTRSLKGLPEKSELRIEVLDLSGNDPTVSLRFASEPGEQTCSLDVGYSYGSLRFYGSVSGKRTRSFSRNVQLRDANGQYVRSPRAALRVFIDNATGEVDVYVNGEHRVKSGQISDRLPGIAGRVTITPYSYTPGAPMIVSGLWAGPWNGELPKPQMSPSTTLVNGDLAVGPPVGLRDNKLVVDVGGEVQVPLERVTEIGFGFATEPVPARCRVRLAGGEVLSGESFRFDAGELLLRHAALGELRVPVARIQELIINPAAFRPLQVIEPRKATSERAAAADVQRVLPVVRPVF